MERQNSEQAAEANPNASEEAALIDRLHHAAKTRYTELPDKPLRKRGIMIALLVMLVAVMVLFAFVNFGQNGLATARQNDLSATQAAREASSGSGIAQLASQQVDGIAEQGTNITDLPAANAGRLPAVGLMEDGNLLPSGNSMFFPIIRNQARLCQNQEAVRIEILSGPNLTPEPGYSYQEGQSAPNVEATWMIKNLSDCSLADWQVWTLQDGKSVIPRFRLGDQVYDPEETGIPFVLAPGQQVELMVPFDPENAKEVNNEWVMVTNGMYLFPAPHLNLQVESWVIFEARTPRQDRPVTNPVLPVQRPPTGPALLPTPAVTQPPPSSRP